MGRSETLLEWWQEGEDGCCIHLYWIHVPVIGNTCVRVVDGASFGTSVSYPEGVLTGVDYYKEYGVYYEMKQIHP